MERRLHLVENGPYAPQRWPSIATASAELRRPRHLHAVRDDGIASPAPAQAPSMRAPMPSRRR